MGDYSDIRRDDGFMIFEQGFDPRLIDQLRAEFERQMAGELATSPTMKVGNRRRQFSIEMTGPFLDPGLYGNPRMLEILNDIFDGDFVLDSIAVIAALPGAKEQQLHTDWRGLVPGASPILNRLTAFAVNVAIPLVDLTPQTGTTQIYPGSHGQGEPEGSADAVKPFLKRGGFYLVDYTLWHRGMPNLGDEIRPILFMIFTRPWFTDAKHFQEQPRINMSRENFRLIPAEHRKLFRRLAAKGAFDLCEKDLLAGA